MTTLNRDSLTAIFLLIVEAGFLQRSFHIREMPFATMGADVWPKIILVPLILCTLAYLARSIRNGPEESSEAAAPGVTGESLLSRYRNVFICYGLFLVFLLTLDILGMLIGGIAFVFLALSAMGGIRPRAMAIHAAVAVVSVGSMWAIFTFALKVFLPSGVIFSVQ